MTESEPNVEFVHDYFKELEWFMLIGGYANLNKNDKRYSFYLLYRILMLIFLLFLDIMAATGGVLSYGNTIDMIQAFHIGLLSTVGTFGVITRYFSDDILQETLQILKDGVFDYNEKEIQKEYAAIKRENVKAIRRMASIFSKMIISVAFTNFLFVPIIQIFVITEGPTKSLMNPYLPQPFYLPFNTRTFLGYSAAYVINLIFMTFLACNVVCMDVIYISCTSQLKAQFQILNHSLRSIERRAYFMFVDNYNDAFTRKYFQNNQHERLELLNRCLKQNIRHHQALIR